MVSCREIAQQQIEAALTSKWETLRRLYAANVEYIDPDGEVRGADAAIERLRSLEEMFSNLGFDIKAVVADESHAVAEWVFSGENTGPLLMPDGSEIPATGRHVEFGVITIYEIRDGTIASERNYWDNLSVYGQLGLLPES